MTHRGTGAIGGAAAIGGVGNFASYTNPRVSFDIPALNQDDVAFIYNNPVAGADAAATATRTANLDEQLVPSDIGLAQLSLTVGAAPNSCDGTSTTTALDTKTLVLAVLDLYGNTVTASAAGTPRQTYPVLSAAFVPDDLVSQQANIQYETADTARAYYDANDPTAAKPARRLAHQQLLRSDSSQLRRQPELIDFRARRLHQQL